MQKENMDKHEALLKCVVCIEFGVSVPYFWL